MGSKNYGAIKNIAKYNKSKMIDRDGFCGGE